jgi:hypothetical protein
MSRDMGQGAAQASAGAGVVVGAGHEGREASAGAATRRWGFLDADGVFVPVPKIPLTLAGLEPPCVVTLYGGERAIIVEPESNP